MKKQLVNVCRKTKSVQGLLLPGWIVRAEAVAAEVAEATPTAAPASTTSLEVEVVTPSCCREEPGISSAENEKHY